MSDVVVPQLEKRWRYVMICIAFSPCTGVWFYIKLPFSSFVLYFPFTFYVILFLSKLFFTRGLSTNFVFIIYLFI